MEIFRLFKAICLMLLLTVIIFNHNVYSQTFSAKTDFTTGTTPRSVSIGDFNGDGKPDMAVSNFISNSISVFLNTTTTGASSPTFSAKTDFITGANPRSVAIGDLNGDGKPDMVAAIRNSNNVTVFFNTTVTGASTAIFSFGTAFTTGTSPRSVFIADINGDGKPDLAVANANSNTVSVLLNTTTPGASAPTFSAKTDFATGTQPRSVFIGDINGDGKLDLAVANNNSNTVSVLLNTTTPGASVATFSAKTDFTTGTNPFAVSIGDINGDGKLDLATANFNSNTVSVLLNTTTPGASAPTFSAKTDFTIGTTPEYVSIGDLNGDGKPDLAAVNTGSNSISVFFNTTTPGASVPTFSAKTDFTTGSLPRYVSIGDLNGDGKPDLAAANDNSNTVSILLNTTTIGTTPASFSTKTDFTTGSNVRSVAISDLNGDGKPDMASANLGSNTVSVFLNTTTPGASTPTFSTKTDFATGASPFGVTLGDLNGDGKPDMASSNLNPTNTVSVFLNTTTPGASTPTFSAKTDFTTGTSPFGVTLGDLNGDGKSDIIASNNSSNSVSILLNTTTPGASTPTFTAKTDFTTGTSPYPASIGDLNGDGKPDIAVPNQSVASVSVLLNTTTPGASTPTFTAKTDFTTGSLPRSVSIGDLNGDGKPDLVVANATSTSVSVLFNTTTPGASTPTFSVKTDFTTGTQPEGVSLGDFNGDGKLDMTVANRNSATASVLLNTTVPGASTPIFSAKTDFATGSAPLSTSTADFNGDGKTDFAMANQTSNTISVLLNNITLPLPVELTTFSASVSGSSVNLFWNTATEVNNYGFEVERIINNEQLRNNNWTKLGFVPGFGTSNTPHSYSFTDNGLFGGKVFSYRLKQIDVDGKFEYSDVLTISLVVPQKAQLLQNSPNPFNPSTSIKFFVPNISNVTIKIYDMLGKEVTTLVNNQLQAGFHIVFWNGKNRFGNSAASGVYLYRLSTNNFAQTKKMTLLK